MSTVLLLLIAEGTSDRALIHVVRWLAGQHLPGVDVLAESVDWSRAPKRGKGLAAKIDTAVKLYPDHDLLLIHRDADAEDGRPARVREIEDAVGELSPATCPRYVCVVPVQETEAWLLIDEQAIRNAAANPTGTAPLDLPRLAVLESVRQPKERLEAMLQKARLPKTGRKALAFDPRKLKQEVALSINSFDPLRQLPAFQQLEADIAAFAAAWLAANPPPAA